MKRPKPVADPAPRKFAPGDRVKPTAIAIKVGWNKPGVVDDCGTYAVQVMLDGESVVGWYAQDFFELE